MENTSCRFFFSTFCWLEKTQWEQIKVFTIQIFLELPWRHKNLIYCKNQSKGTDKNPEQGASDRDEVATGKNTARPENLKQLNSCFFFFYI